MHAPHRIAQHLKFIHDQETRALRGRIPRRARGSSVAINASRPESATSNVVSASLDIPSARAADIIRGECPGLLVMDEFQMLAIRCGRALRARRRPRTENHTACFS